MYYKNQYTEQLYIKMYMESPFASTCYSVHPDGLCVFFILFLSCGLLLF